MPRPLELVDRAAFFVKMACNRALTRLVNARTRLMHDNKYETNYAPNVPYINKYDTVNTILNNTHHMTKTVQKPTKLCNKNNWATKWKKTTSIKMFIQLLQSVQRNITTQTEKQHEMKNVKMKTAELV